MYRVVKYILIGFVVLLLLGILAIPFILNYAIDTVTQITPNACTIELATQMVIDHMKVNDGKWPANWDDLQKPYQKVSDSIA